MSQPQLGCQLLRVLPALLHALDAGIDEQAAGEPVHHHPEEELGLIPLMLHAVQVEHLDQSRHTLLGPTRRVEPGDAPVVLLMMVPLRAYEGRDAVLMLQHDERDLDLGR